MFKHMFLVVVVLVLVGCQTTGQAGGWAGQIMIQKQPAVLVVPTSQSVTVAPSTFVYRNDQVVGGGSTIYASPQDQVALRQQDLREFQVMERAQREAANDQHDRRMDWSRQVQTYQREQQSQAEREANRQLQQQRDQQRAQENRRRDVIRVGQQFGRQVESLRRDAGNRVERYYRSQQ
ncbi:MAG: hypothetical protein Q7T49_01380 [bacterium]|nr:hypothetical protein [bacterium]